MKCYICGLTTTEPDIDPRNRNNLSTTWGAETQFGNSFYDVFSIPHGSPVCGSCADITQLHLGGEVDQLFDWLYATK